MKDKNQVPAYTREEDQGFIPNAINNSATPTVVVPPEAQAGTTVSTDDSYSDPVAQQVKMSNDEQLAFRCKAMNAAKPWALGGAQDTPPSFQAGELKDEDVPKGKDGY